MYKILYWSKKKEKIVVFMFGVFSDLLDYLYQHCDDIEFEEHFIKIVKE